MADCAIRHPLAGGTLYPPHRYCISRIHNIPPLPFPFPIPHPSTPQAQSQFEKHHHNQFASFLVMGIKFLYICVSLSLFRFLPLHHHRQLLLYLVWVFFSPFLLLYFCCSWPTLSSERWTLSCPCCCSFFPPPRNIVVLAFLHVFSVFRNLLF